MPRILTSVSQKYQKVGRKNLGEIIEQLVKMVRLQRFHRLLNNMKSSVLGRGILFSDDNTFDVNRVYHLCYELLCKLWKINEDVQTVTPPRNTAPAITPGSVVSNGIVTPLI
ncbi:unnamed protein product [Lepeophtheirus salmonis]|uniref:(salmon louse) hypothetical protein n=1 Tax=Lepeophtheirus salmonis TaxID=72036 RepID=A0A0K2TU94_LEPSM|nr:unnamed protein product [Lepeophtheirus salmonis]CAF2903322.1 unnamed protein product [Lepeophtheirus salmonis]